MSLAIFEPLEGNEEKALEAIRGLMALLADKKYSHLIKTEKIYESYQELS